jgi:hypothetical protein
MSMQSLSVEWSGERVTLTDESDAKLMGALNAMLQWQEQSGVYDRLFPKKALVGSTGKRNTLCKLSARGDEAKRFPRPCVEFECNGVEIGLTVNG